MKQQQLKRSLGMTAVTFYGIGGILGAGIYVLIGKVAGAAGYFAPASFLLAAIVALFSAFSFADLAARFPHSAGVPVYINEAFAWRLLTQCTGLMVVFTGLVSAATMATGVVGYFQLFIPLPDAQIILLFAVLIGTIAIWGIVEATWIIAAITLIEIGGLLYFIFIASGSIEIPAPALTTDLDAFGIVSGILFGGFLAFYAYIGLKVW